jgi:ComEC/Rec2-related protein
MKYKLWFLLILILIIRFITIQNHFTNGQLLRISGRLFSEPNVSGQNIKFNLSGIRVSAKGDDLHYGDFVVVEGEYKDGIVKGEVKEIVVSNNIFTKIRKRLISFYEDSLSSPHASLVAGITIGAKSTLPRNFSDKLRKTGTSHIVVASGMNISMVAEFILSICLLFISRRKALLITIIFIWIYTLVAGFEAPIIRAAIMGTIAFSTQIFGRIGNTLRYTILTGLIMLIIVPSWLTDVGFLLSFSTTTSLTLFQTKINKLLNFIPPIIKDDLSTSIAAQIGSMPIILYFFGNFNLLSPLINVLVLWIVAPVMIVGALGGLLSFIFPGIAKIILLTIYPLTVWFVSVVNFFG